MYLKAGKDNGFSIGETNGWQRARLTSSHIWKRSTRLDAEWTTPVTSDVPKARPKIRQKLILRCLH
ncbi:hypothetical protein CH63R_02089 [Colletotrichum higginsianum IMI 349063]|uniref:Uncharacterized protein n=1 Tax=Colletotrichum higginsianum (strain IMI 349063) TaxID=759273 RepID=A0A1B7YMV1_COLHI|nr:hypothetical protein CH63R_02089 [Colletotrichum higginsianum IMI 349063]OBR13363.1 hypothetical protein CH63R_02089 [Colletotrichum higginsianum IMI 349063]